MPAPPPAIVAALTLIAGFGVADLTGVRPLGGLVLFAGALWCGLQWKARRGLPVAIGLIVVFLVLFAASHPLGKAIGAWPAVFTVAAAMALAGWAVADRHLTRSEATAR
ncbi:MAG: hypothetical protein PGN13_11245 [Patulibacter minatonensis]